jgi:hypothetical protein
MGRGRLLDVSRQCARLAGPIGVGLFAGLLVNACESNSSPGPSPGSGARGGSSGDAGGGGKSSGGMPSAGGSAGTLGSSGTAGSSGSSGTAGTSAVAAGGADDSGGTSGAAPGSGGTSGAAGGSGPEAGFGGVPSEGGASGGDDGVEELGGPCDSLASLACAGNHQRVTLICGADRRWEVNQTCGGDQVCDTSAGIRRGSCQDRLPECRDFDPGYRFCQDATTLMECGPDNVTTALVETCTGACWEAACDNRPNHCPREAFVNCADDCGENTECSPYCPGIEWYIPIERAAELTFRIPGYAGACTDECSDAIRVFRIFQDLPILNGMPALRVRVPPPWKVVVAPSEEDVCELLSVAAECTAYEGYGDEDIIVILTDDPSAAAANVTITVPETGVPTCP